MKKHTLRRISTSCLAAAVLGLVIAGSAPAAAGDSWTTVAIRYETIRRALVDDSLAGVPDAAAALRREIESLRGDLTAARAGVAAESLAEVKELLPEAEAAARDLAAAQDLAAARDAFYTLTKPLVKWRQARGSGPAVAYCAMEKRSWLQPAGEEMGNPYLGHEMSTCGEIVHGA